MLVYIEDILKICFHVPTCVLYIIKASKSTVTDVVNVNEARRRTFSHAVLIIQYVG